MKLSVIVPVLALMFVPFSASAHEQQIFEINGEAYRFTIGSLNEPITVDDKTGLDLRVTLVDHEEMAANDHHAAGGAVAGLEETLKAELIAGGQKKAFPLSPVYGAPGSYKTTYYPTVPTTISYRIFGEIEGTPVDLTFTCSSAGHAQAQEDTSRMEVSPSVVRTLKTGAFGCPVSKEELGFPEPSASVASLADQAEAAKAFGLGAGALALAALAAAFVRRRS